MTPLHPSVFSATQSGHGVGISEESAVKGKMINEVPVYFVLDWHFQVEKILHLASQFVKENHRNQRLPYIDKHTYISLLIRLHDTFDIFVTTINVKEIAHIWTTDAVSLFITAQNYNWMLHNYSITSKHIINFKG